MATLYNADTGEELGHISHQDLERILRILECNDGESDEFPIDEETIDMLEEHHIKASAINILRHAIGDEDSIQVSYEED